MFLATNLPPPPSIQSFAEDDVTTIPRTWSTVDNYKHCIYLFINNMYKTRPAQLNMHRSISNKI